MTRLPDTDEARASFMDTGWSLYLAEAGTWTRPEDLEAVTPACAARVPGTVAGALEAAGLFDRNSSLDLDRKDAWYLTEVSGPSGLATLYFDGLATIAEVFLNGQSILSCDSMFVPHSVEVYLTGQDQLAIWFHALGPALDRKGPRARWRPQMITPQGLRMVRTTLLGRMPGWCPDIHAVGPWRPVRLVRNAQRVVSDVSVSAVLEGDGTGRLLVRACVHADFEAMVIECAGISTAFRALDNGWHEAGLIIPDVAPWWPQTHGTPCLHDVYLCHGQERLLLCRTGFRRVAVSRGAEGCDFELLVNDVPVFCRGAVWTTADIVRLPGGREDYRPWLELARDAGFNMIRIGGTMAYESAEFYHLCDELGLMVWQDAMLANFDYPAGDTRLAGVIMTEIEQLLERTLASPSLVVFCGGSEMQQQAAMLGLPAQHWSGPLTQDMIPGVVAGLRPDIVYVENSPSGGAMPFSPNAGVTHYYGVGAYCRPLEDARRANVRFAAESLAFAHVPEQVTLDTYWPVAPVHDPRWKARVPRDRGASWDFEDVRDFYLALLYGVDANRLRRENPARYLDLSRAVTGEVVEATFAEWRRSGSSCHGALVWTLQDLLPGAGWGVIDSTGLPKPVYHALRRAFRPVQLVLGDEGTNGLDLHLINETAGPQETLVDIACLRDGVATVVKGQREIVLPPRSTTRLAATDLFGAFFDTTYAFRFGPPSHDVTVARLRRADDGHVIASAFAFPQGRMAAMHEARLTCNSGSDAGGHFVDIQTDRFAQSVQIACGGFLPDDNWFHLAPGETRRVKLQALSAAGQGGKPQGSVQSLGSGASACF